MTATKDWVGDIRNAADDLSAAMSRRWLWTALGWNDVRQRHAGSLIGSVWITANLGLMIGCLTLVFAGALGESIRHYAPYVAIGLVLWQFVSSSLNEGSQVFINAAETIRNAPMPLSLHVFRLIWRNLLVMAHHIVLIPLFLLLFQIMPSSDAWLAMVGLSLLALFAFFSALLLGLLGARFRDLAPIVGNLMQLLFFLTPVFWMPAAIGPAAAWLSAFNPLAAFIDIIRSPLLGESPLPGSWPIALAVTAATGIAAIIALARTRRRLAYWV